MQKAMTTSVTERFIELFNELEDCDEENQKQKIEEMNEVMDEMDRNKRIQVFTKEIFNKIDKMIEEKKISLENVILIIKHLGFCKMLGNVLRYNFCFSLLGKRFEKMIIDEEKKKEVKNEKLLIDLCKCSLLLRINSPSKELISICVPCLLKAALNKEKSEKTQKEVEMTLQALSCIPEYARVEQTIYLNEIKEIIEYHQKFHNLTQFAYQSAWQFLINRLFFEKNLEEVITSELHFCREVSRELEELFNYLSWKKVDNGRKGEELKVSVIKRWISFANAFFSSFKLWNEEYVALLRSLVKLCAAARGNERDVSCRCIEAFRSSAENRVVGDDGLLESGAFDTVLEEIRQSTLNDEIAFESLRYFLSISNRLKKEDDDETDEAKIKSAKRKVLEIMEEEGYEDAIISFHEIFDFITENIIVH